VPTTDTSTKSADACSTLVIIQIQASEQYFHTVLFIMLDKAVVNVACLDETLVCDHSKGRF